MALREHTPCDCDGFCPYDAEYMRTCEYYCGAHEPQDIPETEKEEAEMRDFDWFDELYAVINEDGSYAGKPCTSYEEARELAAQVEGRRIFMLQYDNSNFEDDYEDGYDEIGYNPYLGCEDFDC